VETRSRTKPRTAKTAVPAARKPKLASAELAFRKAATPSAEKVLHVRDIRHRLGLSRKLFSRLSGYSERAVAEWEAGKPMSTASIQRLNELARLEDGLNRVMKRGFIPDWLQAPNGAFSGLKPLEVVERGEIDRLWGMIFRLESGTPS
jgi:transcriptional regulator with XRE-family HTH domain